MRKRQFFVHRTDVDNLAYGFRLHAMLDERLAYKKRTLKVHIENQVIIRLVHLPEVRAAFQSRIVHQDINTAQFFYGVRDKTLPFGNLTHVTRKRGRSSARFLRRRDNFLGATFVGAIAQRNVRAFPGQALHDRSSDPLVTPGNGNHFAFQSVCHVDLLHSGSPMRCAEGWNVSRTNSAKGNFRRVGSLKVGSKGPTRERRPRRSADLPRLRPYLQMQVPERKDPWPSPPP